MYRYSKVYFRILILPVIPVSLYKTKMEEYNFGVSDKSYLRFLNDSAEETLNAVSTVRCPISGTQFVVAGGISTIVTVWDLEIGAIDCELKGHHANVWGVACLDAPLSKDIVMATCGADKLVIIWDWECRKIKHQLTHHTDIVWAIATALVASFHSYPIVVSGGRDRNCVVCCAETGTILKVLNSSISGHTAGIRAIAIADPSQFDVNKSGLIITGSNDNNIILWSLNSGEVMHKLIGHVWSVISISYFFVPGNADPIIVSGSVDKNIFLWDISTQSVARKIKLDDKVGMISSIVVSHPTNYDQPSIVCSDSNGIVRMIDLRTGELMRQLIGRGEINGLAVVNRTNKLAEQVIAVGVKGVDIFELAAIDRLHNFRTANPGPMKACALYVEQRKTHPCVALYATVGATPKIVLWDDNNVRIHNLYGGHTDGIQVLQFNTPDTHHEPVILASGGWDHVICVWDCQTGTILKRLIGHDFRISSLSLLSLSGNIYLLSGSMYRSRENVVLWNAASGDILHKKLFSTRDCFSTFLYKPSLEIQKKSGIWTEKSMICIAAMQDSYIYVHDFDSKALHILSTGRSLHSIYNLQLCLICMEDISIGTVYLLGGGHSNSIMLWNLLTGDVLHEFVGHTDSILSMAIIKNPHFMNGDSILVSGSADSTIKLWSIERKTLVQTRNGHRHRVLLVYGISRTATTTAAAATTTTATTTFPFLFSACEDKLCYEHDLSYDCSVLPPRGHVGRCFEIDRIEHDGKWSRISKLSQLYGNSFWLDNSQLLVFAVWYQEEGFIIKFRHEIKQSLKRTRSILDNRSFMKYCITYGSIVLIKIVLRVWANELNKPISDFSDQHYFHLSYKIDIDDLVLLAKKFPIEFSEFICSLRIRPAHKSVYPSDYRLDLGDSGIQIATCGMLNHASLWNDLIEKNKDGRLGDNKQPFTIFYVPLLRVTDVRLLRAFVETSITLQSVDIMNSDVGEIALRQLWRSAGKNIHLNSLYIYIVYILVYVFNVYTFDYFMHYNRSSYVVGWISQVLVLMFASYYVYREWAQAHGCRQTYFNRFVGSVWSSIAGMSLVAVLIGSIWRLIECKDTKGSRSVLAIASILIWFNLLYFFKAFASSGPLGTSYIY